MLEFKRLTASTVAAISLALPATAAAQHQDLRSEGALSAAQQAEKETRPSQDLRNADRQFPDTGVRVPQVEPATPPSVRVVEVSADGFDWGDAGIGAAGGLAILTLAGGMVAVGTHRRRGAAIS